METYSSFDDWDQKDAESESLKETMIACARNNAHYQQIIRFKSKQHSLLLMLWIHTLLSVFLIRKMFIPNPRKRR